VIFSVTKESLNEQIDLIELTDSIVKTISDQGVEANISDRSENNKMPLETRNSVEEEDIICLEVEDDNQCSFCLLNFVTQSNFFAFKLN
jgi:predicted transcriptional regulator